jgi:hypothetical protein
MYLYSTILVVKYTTEFIIRGDFTDHRGQQKSNSALLHEEK